VADDVGHRRGAEFLGGDLAASTRAAAPSLIDELDAVVMSTRPERGLERSKLSV
jgi:hypothetical protein